MKVLRILFYLLMPVFLFAGLYTGLRLWFILLISQILLVLIIVALNLWTVRTFSYTQHLDDEEAVKGGETALHISIRNEKPFPLSLMQVHVEMANPAEHTQIAFSLLPFAGREFDFKVSMPYRGVYPVGITTLRITDVFGLLPMTFDMRKLHFYRQPQLTICPRAEAPSPQYAEVADEKLFGEQYLLNAEGGSSISGARAYRPGDPLKQIHWKKSAAHGELYVKQYEQPVRENVTLLIDNCNHGVRGEEALARADTVCEAASCVTLHCLTSHRSAFLRALCETGGQHPGEEAADEGDFETVRRWLARLPFGEQSAGGELPVDQTELGSALVLITAACTEELIAAAAAAAPCFSSVTLILVGEEHRDTGSIPAVYLPVGCDAAAELAMPD